MATNLTPEQIAALLRGELSGYTPTFDKWSYQSAESGGSGSPNGVGPQTGWERMSMDGRKGSSDMYDMQGGYTGTRQWEEDSDLKSLAKGLTFLVGSYFGIDALLGPGGLLQAGGGAGASTAGAAVEPAIGMEGVSSAFPEAIGSAGGSGSMDAAIAASADAGALGGATNSLAAAGASGAGGLTPAAIESLLGTPGYGANAAASAFSGVPSGLQAAGGLGGGGFMNWLTGLPAAAGNALSNVTGGDLLRFGAPLLSAGVNAWGIDKATDAQADAAKESNALLKSIYDQNVARNQPFVTGGVQGFYSLLDKLGLSGNTGAQGYGSLNRATSPQDVLNTPGYQFGMNQGLKAQQQKLNAQGMSYSGPAIKAATRYGTDYATTKFNDAFNRDEASKTNEYNRLMGVTNVGQSAANFQANSGTQYANQVGSNLQGAANASAAGTLGMTNALSGAINQGISAYQNKPYEDAYLAYLRSIGAAPGG